MIEKWNHKWLFLYALSLGLAAAALTIFLLSGYYGRRQFQAMGDFCGELIERRPDCRQTVMEILKTRKSGGERADENILISFGYEPQDFLQSGWKVLLIAGGCFFTGGAGFLLAFCHWRKETADGIRALTHSLERINTGGQGMLFDTAETELARLQDEIYKTVTALYQTRDAALAAKRNFAENLSNIAHQLKTPLTAISLSVQMIQEPAALVYARRIQRQLLRLTHMEEALLLLSRIDGGTLALKPAPTDVFTIFTLAADNLQELFAQTGVSADIPETGEILVDVDLEWTMEAVMNLMKNCMEHAPAKTAVHCSWEKNPLYVQMRIWDEGQGFSREDLPHLFERFYRGKRAAAKEGGGIGIGLALARAIIEMQDGMLSAFNRPEGGACFEIRFWHSHRNVTLL